MTRDSTSHSLDWYRFTDDFPEIPPGCLEWVRAQDPPHRWDVVTCEEAAREGDLKLLEWVRAQDPPCPWDASTCASAANRGHLDVLMWVRSQDPPCPWEEWTCTKAAGEGHLDVLQWVREQDPPCPWSRRECIENASEYGHQHVIDWIDQREDESDVDDEHFGLRNFEDFRMS